MTVSPLHNYMAELHQRYAQLDEGGLADYIPELTKANPDWFGIVLVTVDGHVYTVGDTDIGFTIQSISKPFTYGIALEDRGVDYIRTKINVEPTGEAFNRISLEHSTGRPRNPMINAGAIATVGQLNGAGREEKIARILDTYSLLAGRSLTVDEAVYRSERDTGHRNRAIAHLLLNSGIIDGDPEDTLDVYFKQCSILVTCRDLAIMAATLANQGRNPVTGTQVIRQDNVSRILSVMSSCGMYDGSGTWTYDIGLPSKSGVGGGIAAVLPGKSAIAVFSPRLDAHGNSVRGIKVCQAFSEALGLHVFKSDRMSAFSVIRSSYTVAEVRSKRIRTKKASAILSKDGDRVRVYELSGELGFSAAEVVLSRVMDELDNHDTIIFNLRRVVSIDQAATQMIAHLIRILKQQNKSLFLTHTDRHAKFLGALDSIVPPCDYPDVMQVFPDVDRAAEWCEQKYLVQAGFPEDIIRTTYLSQQELLAGLTSAELDLLTTLGQERHYCKGDYLCRAGDTSTDLYLILSGYVSIMLSLASGKQQRVATFDAGSAIGEFSVVDKRPRSADIVASTSVKCLVIDLERLEQDTSDKARRVRAKIIENLARRLVELLRKANREIAALNV